MSDLYVSKAFKDVWNTVKPTIVLVGGRLGGKTKFVINKTLTMILGEEQIDGVVCRSSYGSLRDSSYSEYVNAIQELQIENYFHIIKSPLRIVCLANNNPVTASGAASSWSSSMNISMFLRTLRVVPTIHPLTPPFRRK